MSGEMDTGQVSGLRESPLHAAHVEAGGKMVPFAGYSMPIHYEAGIRTEHETVRERVGVFDVSHMGEVEIGGPGATELVQRLTVNDASRLVEGQAQYSAMCREDGGILDDLLVYRFPEHYMLVVNATRRHDDLEWIREHARGLEVEVRDRSDETALLALQGPSSEKILARLAGPEVREISYYRFRNGQVTGIPAVVSRTGYTGEDGFELYLEPEGAITVWNALLDAGSGEGVLPVGLGARDSLRLEMGYALYGQDLDPDHTPLEAGLGWITRLDEEADFVGREALRRQEREGVERTLVGLGLEERGFPRPGYPVLEGGREVGAVTSGTVSPTLGRGIALAYVPTELSHPDTALAVAIRGREVPAKVEKPPFYREGSIKR